MANTTANKVNAAPVNKVHTYFPSQHVCPFYKVFSFLSHGVVISMEKLCNYLDFPHSILVHLSLYILCKWPALKYTLLVSEGSLYIQSGAATRSLGLDEIVYAS